MLKQVIYFILMDSTLHYMVKDSLTELTNKLLSFYNKSNNDP